MLIEMIHCKAHQNQTQNDVASSFAGRRRIIFPTIHDKYHTLPAPIITRSKLSDHIKNYKRNPSLTPSIESDMPSLASLSIVSESTSTSIPSMSSDDSHIITDDCRVTPMRKAVRFDPRIWVHEFDRPDADRRALWFTVQDLNTFKFGAMRCIMAYNSRVPNSATTQMSKSTWKKQTGSVLFSHPALGLDNDYDDCAPDVLYQDTDSSGTAVTSSPLVGTSASGNSMVNQFREAVADNEIRNILVVDPQEICLKLYAKGLRHLFPSATIVTARNKEEALHQIRELSTKTKSGHDFDIIVSDEAKSSGELDSTGPSLFERIKQSTKTPGLNIIVVSQRNANRHDPETDFMWTKPPPSMNGDLRDQILKAVLIKRGRNDIAKKLYR